MVKPREPEKFNILDGDHKVLVLDCEILKAVPNKRHTRPETFFILTTNLRSAKADRGSPVLLAVCNGEFCLCCEKDCGKRKPSLRLKKKKLMELAVQKEPARRPFIFYWAKVGSRYTLESAVHPGWFMCTSCNYGEPVAVTNKVGRRKHIEFYFTKVKTAPAKSAI
ncbi:interleukin-37 isoform X1 [Ochotona princeps]|uniref:interleukin-37 isoform X1 n=1 Tax=Ochotona princeps TaxID=9978 RepID=UPI0027152754|nr:interleukin-37 isoform X1 [Ochotona princeps]XP_058523376.1 interleukin-37 isoform X1 [Ochotona princeps]